MAVEARAVEGEGEEVVEGTALAPKHAIYATRSAISQQTADRLEKHSSAPTAT